MGRPVIQQLIYGRNAIMNIKERAKKLKLDVPAVFIALTLHVDRINYCWQRISIFFVRWWPTAFQKIIHCHFHKSSGKALSRLQAYHSGRKPRACSAWCEVDDSKWEASEWRLYYGRTPGWLPWGAGACCDGVRFLLHPAAPILHPNAPIEKRKP